MKMTRKVRGLNRLVNMLIFFIKSHEVHMIHDVSDSYSIETLHQIKQLMMGLFHVHNLAS